jgi:hypothetical protein
MVIASIAERPNPNAVAPPALGRVQPPDLSSPVVAARIASTLLVVGLLAGTMAAFVVTERLKLVRSPIAAPRVDRVVGPLCDCAKAQAQVVFELRERDRITVAIVDSDERVVRTLVEGTAAPAGDVEATWDGRDDAGRVVREGSYSPRIRLERQRRTITLRNPILVDTTPPQIRVVDVRPRRLSPGIGETNNRLDVRYEVDEPARALLYVDGERHAYTYRRPLEGKIEWFGRRGGARLPSGTYRLELAAEDVAGNVSEPVSAGTVEIRYMALAREEIAVPAGFRFSIRVSTDAESFDWLFARGRGTARPGQLVLRAPRSPGRYTLFVQAGGRAARARVIVLDR